MTQEKQWWGGVALKGFEDFVFILLNYVILLMKCINDIVKVYMQFSLSVNIVTSKVNKGNCNHSFANINLRSK